MSLPKQENNHPLGNLEKYFILVTADAQGCVYAALLPPSGIYEANDTTLVAEVLGAVRVYPDIGGQHIGPGTTQYVIDSVVLPRELIGGAEEANDLLLSKSYLNLSLYPSYTLLSTSSNISLVNMFKAFWGLEDK